MTLFDRYWRPFVVTLAVVASAAIALWLLHPARPAHQPVNGGNQGAAASNEK